MWVLLCVRDKTVERENVHFIGVFNSLLDAKQEVDHLIATTHTKRCNYVLKPVKLNHAYDYDWSISKEDEIK